MEKYTIVGLSLLILGISLSITGFLVLKVYELVSSGIAAVIVGGVMLAIGTSRAKRPVSVLEEVEKSFLWLNYRRLLEEVGLVDRSPIFAPSSKTSRGPCMIIPLTGDVRRIGNPDNLPDRFLVYTSDFAGIRFNYPIEELQEDLRVGGEVSVSGGETLLNNVIVSRMNAATAVRLTMPEENVFVVEVEGFESRVGGWGNMNVLSASIGLLLAEYFNKIVALRSFEVSEDTARLVYEVVEGVGET